MAFEQTGHVQMPDVWRENSGNRSESRKETNMSVVNMAAVKKEY